MTFGEKLKAARIESGLKQSELAKELKTTGNTISNWENNVSKPDLDTLSYICGILHVTASYFLQATIPDDEVSIPELKLVKKYRALDPHGKEMVDFTLLKEWERSTAEQKVIPMTVKEKENTTHYVNAAHPIDGASEEDKHFDENIMNEENF